MLVVKFDLRGWEFTYQLKVDEDPVSVRPITCISSDPLLAPPTPSMFLSEQNEYDVLDYDTIDRISLCRKLRCKQKLRDDVRKRLRTEY